jgi:hypothetical protein
MATRIATSTAVPLYFLLQRLKTEKKCNPEDLESLHITVDRQADLQFDDRLPASELTEVRKFLDTRHLSDVFKRLKDSKEVVLQFPRVAPGGQNLVARYAVEILEDFCGLALQRTYSNGIHRLELSVRNRRYTPPDLGIPISYGSEFTLDGARICTAYLPQLQGEAGCAVYAREMFCLLAMAKKSRQASPESQSYRVSTLSRAERSQTLLTP